VVERRSNGCSGGPLWAEDLRGVRVERVHDFGEVYLALSLRRAFGFGRTLAGWSNRGAKQYMGTGGLSTDFGALLRAGERAGDRRALVCQ
jgi:hypothetical protein